MEWILALIIAAITLLSFILPLCFTVIAFGAVIWGLIYWLQTLMFVLEHEHGEDRLTWMIVVIALSVVGALMYRVMRPLPAQPRAMVSSWNASGRVAAPGGLRKKTQYSGRQVALISISSVIIGACLLCGGLIAFSVWYDPQLPTIITVTPASGPTPFPTFPPLPFPTIDWTPR